MLKYIVLVIWLLATMDSCMIMEFLSQLIIDVGDTHGISDRQVLEKQEHPQIQTWGTYTNGISDDELEKQEQPHAQPLGAHHEEPRKVRLLKRGGVILFCLIVLWVLPLIFVNSLRYLLTDSEHFSINVSNTVKCCVFSLMCVIFLHYFHSRTLLIAVAWTIVYCATTSFIVIIGLKIYFHQHRSYFIVFYTCSTVPAFACSYGLFYMS